MSNGKIILKAGREKSLLRKHPWVFSGSVQRVDGSPQAGETVDIFDSKGTWLARGAYSSQSCISARVWTFDESESVDVEYFRRRLARAATYRASLCLEEETNAWRLIHGEADGLPGLVVDRYGDFFVLQSGTCGIERWKKEITHCLMEFPGIRGVYERSDIDSRKREGLEPVCGVLCGEEPPERFEIREGALRLYADIRNGHKTGYYLDQRVSRRSLGSWIKGKSFLNCFCYSGGFGLRAALDGAGSVIQVDASEGALELARANAELNGIQEGIISYERADVFQLLRSYRDARRTFDVIVLDPPKFADTQAQLEKACRGYKDINLLAFKLLNPGGTLLTFSCSAAMTPELFRKVVGDAARDAKRVNRVVRTMEQAPDHPRSLDFPEGDYLTGLICRVE